MWFLFCAKSMQGLRCHRYKRHGILADMHWLAVCNVCPRCRTVFKTRQNCHIHCKNIGADGFCGMARTTKNPLGLLGNKAMPPRTLVCKLCELECDNLEELLDHLQLHFNALSDQGFIAEGEWQAEEEEEW